MRSQQESFRAESKMELLLRDLAVRGRNLIHFQDALEKWIVFVEAFVQRHFVPCAVIVEQLFERRPHPHFHIAVVSIPGVWAQSLPLFFEGTH